MDEAAGRSQRLLQASERVGVSPEQNFEWLLNFAQGHLRKSQEEIISEVLSPDLWDEISVFIWKWNGANMLPVSPGLSVHTVESLRSGVLRALRMCASGELPRIEIRKPYTLVLGDDEDFYEGDEQIVFVLAWSRLLRTFKKDVAVCAYEKCDRGSLGTGPRIFLRSRHSKYCCQACGNNARSDKFLAKAKSPKKGQKRRGAR